MSILNLFRRPKIGINLPEPSAWLANGILDTLRMWHRQRGTLVLMAEDIEHLAEWAAKLQEEHQQVRQWCDAGFTIHEIKEPIYANS